MKLNWSDGTEIGAQLYEEHPELDPLKLSFTKLRDMVVALEDFEGAADGCSEGTLERIQMVWLDEWRLDHE